MRRLIHLPYSPWSERAAWALDRKGIAVDREVYEPVLGELGLRRLRRGVAGPPSVPVLVWEGGVIGDSGAIARWADERGPGPSLFPDGVAEWEAVADRALGAGRALGLRRVLGDPGALGDLVPGVFRPFGPIGRAGAALGVHLTLRKYGAAGVRDEDHRATLVDALDRIRAGLGGRATLLADFSYADITVAQALAFVDPPAPGARGIRIPEATRRAFRDPELAARYADLVHWRDRLYADR